MQQNRQDSVTAFCFERLPRGPLAAVLVGAFLAAAGLAVAIDRPGDPGTDFSVGGIQRTNRSDLMARLNPETVAKIEAKNPAKPLATPEPTLVEQFPQAFDQIVVAEVNDGEYVLTRETLERMTTARFGSIKPGMHPSVLADLNRKREEMMIEIAQDWAILKGIAVLAYRSGLDAKPDEIDACLNAANQQAGSVDVRQAISRNAALVGMSSEELQRDMRDALVVDKFIQREVDTNVKDEQLRKIYNSMPQRYMTPLRVHAWQIFVHTDPQVMSKDELKEASDKIYKASKIIGRAKSKDLQRVFQEQARALSEEPVAKARGGDMGFVDASSGLPQEVAAKIFNELKPGQVAGPFKTKLGYHIVYVSERQAPQGATFDASARKAVIDDLVARYKSEVGPGLLLAHPELKACVNISGYRLLSQPLALQPLRTPPPDHRAAIAAGAPPAPPTPAPALTPAAAAPAAGLFAAPDVTPFPVPTATPRATPRPAAGTATPKPTARPRIQLPPIR